MIINESLPDEKQEAATATATATAAAAAAAAAADKMAGGNRTHRSRSTGSRPMFVMGTPPPSDDGKDNTPHFTSTLVA